MMDRPKQLLWNSLPTSQRAHDLPMLQKSHFAFDGKVHAMSHAKHMSPGAGIVERELGIAEPREQNFSTYGSPHKPQRTSPVS